jgi:hypothetical protein
LSVIGYSKVGRGIESLGLACLDLEKEGEEDMIGFLVMDTGFASSQKRKRLWIVGGIVDGDWWFD